MEAWNIKQLKESLDYNLQFCNNAFEISMCKAIAGKDIREKAAEWARSRKLTPAEIAIAMEFGYRP